MDEDLKSVLLDIANEFKERNRLARESLARTEERLKESDEMRSRLGMGKDRLGDLESMRKKNEERMEAVKKQSDQRAVAKGAFEHELITEIKRLNTNLESYFGKKN